MIKRLMGLPTPPPVVVGEGSAGSAAAFRSMLSARRCLIAQRARAVTLLPLFSPLFPQVFRHLFTIRNTSENTLVLADQTSFFASVHFSS